VSWTEAQPLGAAEGLRRRVGLRAWPTQRQGKAELVADVRQALGADPFDQVYAAGSRLTRREAVAAAATHAMRALEHPEPYSLTDMRPGRPGSARRTL
jgi:hypothetical protein